MICNHSLEEKFRQGRLDAKTPTICFDAGLNRGPTVHHSSLWPSSTPSRRFTPRPRRLRPPVSVFGQTWLLVVAAGEPAGKPLEQCQKVTVRLTLDAAQEDFQIRDHGVEGLRRSRILRLTAEARDQGGLLSYEDLPDLFNCGVRTIVRDVQVPRAAATSPSPPAAAQ